jgi:hypothetical protein
MEKISWTDCVKNEDILNRVKEERSILQTMTFYSQYIYSLVLYTVNNKHLFDANNEIHKYKTRNNNNLHFPLASL